MKLMAFGVLMMLTTAQPSHAQDSAPLNVSEWRAARQILEGAKAKISVGWAQGFPEGRAVYCMATALESTLLEYRMTLVDFDYAKLALNEAIEAPAALPTFEGDPLSTPYWGRFYMYWNDAPGRTKEEVLAAMDKAIEIAKAREADAVKANRTGTDVENFDKKSIQLLGLANQ